MKHIIVRGDSSHNRDAIDEDESRWLTNADISVVGVVGQHGRKRRRLSQECTEPPDDFSFQESSTSLVGWSLGISSCF